MPEGRKPTVEKIISLAARPSTLKGKTVALYHNDKVASFSVVHSKAPFMRHPDRAIEEALKADAVVAGTAD